MDDESLAAIEQMRWLHTCYKPHAGLQVECYSTMFKQVGFFVFNVNFIIALTFWFVLLLIGMYVCRLRHTIGELFELFHVIPGNPSIGQCEWANLWIRRLDCWFQQWAEMRNPQTKHQLFHTVFMRESLFVWFSLERLINNLLVAI